MKEKLNNIEVLHFREIDSTNLEAKRQIKSGASLPMLIVADGQTAGKGRMGRNFYSPENTGLYMSYAFEPEFDFSDSMTVTSAAAVAVCRAIEALTDLKPKIKWVNDIYIDSKKVCGILTEAVTAQKTAVIVGIGVNITTESFPDEIKCIAASLNTEINTAELAVKITEQLCELIQGLPQRTFLAEYKQKSCTLGETVEFVKDGVRDIGYAVDITRDGGLVVQTSVEGVVLSSGEITVRTKK